MAELAIVSSTLLMGLFLLVIVGALSRARNWQRHTTETPAPSASNRVLHDPMAWTVGFVLLVLAFGGGAVLLVSGAGVPAAVTANAGLLIGAGFGALLGGFLLVGLYSSGRSRGLGSAPAAALTVLVFGFLLITAIAVQLVLAG